MARFTYGMNLSLDGYVDHMAFEPDPVLFQHWTDHVRGLSGSIYGRRMYDVMRYWDDDLPDWTPERRAFAQVWRAQPKWVLSRSLTSVGPNATLLTGDAEAEIRRIKADHDGEIAVSGTVVAQGLGALGLIDEYRLYLHPVVLGGGTPFFAGALPPLRLAGSDRIGADVIRLTYHPA